MSILLHTPATLWRKVYDSGTGVYTDTEITRLFCAISQISQFDQLTPYARESTHVIWVQYWLVLKKEDMIHVSRRVDAQGEIADNVFTVNGRDTLFLGMTRRSYFCRLLD